MSRILLTGAAGFLGTHLTERFLADGHEVIGVDNLSSGRRSNLARWAGEPRFRFVEADASLPLDIRGELDWILHFASPASPPRYLKLPIETLRVNAEGTRHLLDLAASKGASFFLASTSEVYGDPKVHPQTEDYWGHVNPIGPRSIYDEAKRYAEAMTMAHHRARGTDVRIVRIFNTYGPWMDPHDGRVVSNMLRQALAGEPLTVYGDGRQTRSFCYATDLVEGIVRLMRSGIHAPVNIGNPHEITMLELAEVVQRLTSARHGIRHEPLPVDDPRQRRPDISRARKELGWEPIVPLNEGLRRTLAAMKSGPMR